MRSPFLYPGYNYLGPFNQVTEAYRLTHPPVNALDGAAMVHDLEYARIIRTCGNAMDAYILFNKADRDFMRTVRRLRRHYRNAGRFDEVQAADVALAVFTKKMEINQLVETSLDHYIGTAYWPTSAPMPPLESQLPAKRPAEDDLPANAPPKRPDLSYSSLGMANWYKQLYEMFPSFYKQRFANLLQSELEEKDEPMEPSPIAPPPTTPAPTESTSMDVDRARGQILHPTHWIIKRGRVRKFIDSWPAPLSLVI